MVPSLSARSRSRWQRPVRLIVLAAFVVAFAMSTVGLLDTLAFIGKPFPGFGYTDTLLINPVLFAPDVPDYPDVGLWARIVSLDGTPVSAVAEFTQAIRTRTPGEVMTLGVELLDGTDKLVSVPLQRFTLSDFFRWHTNQTVLALVIILIGGLVLFLRSGARPITFSLVCLATGLMCLGGVDGTLFHRFPQLFHFSATLLPAAGMAFAVTLSPRLARHPRAPLLWIIPLVMGLVLALALLSTQYGPVPVYAALGVAVYAFLLVGAGGFFVIMWDAWRRSEVALDRARAGVIVLTWPLGMGIPAFNLLMGFALRVWPLTAIPNVAVLLLPLSVGYAILRQDLFEADLALRRLFADMLLTGSFTCLYALALFGAYTFLPGADSPAVAVALAALLLALAVPVRDRVKRQLDRVVEGRRYDAEHALSSLAAALSTELSLDRALHRVADTLTSTVRPGACSVAFSSGPGHHDWTVRSIHGPEIALPERRNWKDAAMVLRGTGRPFNTWAEDRDAPIVVQPLPADLEVVVPLRAAGREVGALLVGPRADGRRYSNADLTFLRAVAGQAAPMLANARAFDEVEELNHTLEERVRARTAELTAVNDELRELDRKKDELIGTISHDFRSPLSIIRSHVQTMITDHQMDETTRQSFLGVIDRQARRLSSMAENLLDLARLHDRGLTAKTLSVMEVLKSAADGVRPRLDAVGVRLVLELPPPSLKIQADPERLLQVFQNLLDNAAKFTPRGGEIRLYTRTEADGVVLGVTDTGVGIPLADQPRVCEPFYQVKRAGAEREGSGLGLAIVKEVVERHGSKLHLISREGVGTTWEFVLPAHEGP